MPSIETDKEMGRENLIQQCKSALAAGGTVYLGETHKR